MRGLDAEVVQALDTICALGCEVVSAYIQALRQGDLRPEYQGLSTEQRASLLHQLESVMAVYEGK